MPNPSVKRDWPSLHLLTFVVNYRSFTWHPFRGQPLTYNVRPLMKSFLLFLVLSFPVFAAEPALVRTLDVEAGETYIQLYPRDGFLFIKEYSLSTLAAPASVNAQVTHITSLIRKARYCKDRYGLEAFTAIEERIYRDRSFVTVECRLLTRKKNLIQTMTSAFAGILNRPVIVTISDTDIGLHYDGAGLVVRTSNAEGVFAKGRQRVIFWRNGTPYYEAVFAREGSTEADFKSIAPYFGEDVASPKKSEAEIKAWKDAK